MVIPSELWCDTQGTLTRVVRVEGKKLVALEVDNAACAPRLGAQYVGKVVRLLPALNAVEVDLGDSRAFMKAKGLKAGELVLVAWLAPPVGDKLAVVKRIEGEATGAPRLLQDGEAALQRISSLSLSSLRRKPESITDGEMDSGVRRNDECIRHDDFDLLDLNAQIDALLARRVPLGKNGSLIFDRTEAAHVIDVNGTGKDINRQAIAEIARQIRLRNLGGIILIDLVGDARKLEKGLTEALRDATKDDPCTVEVYGVSKLGILELTRERRGWELASLLSA